MLGHRIRSCPWRAMRDPFVIHVMAAWMWWKKGELGTRYGGDPPEALMRGVTVFDGAMNRVDAYDAQQDREEQKRERDRREREAQSAPPRALHRSTRRR